MPLSVPEIAIIAGTRAAFGAGVALLLGGFLKPDTRKAVGWTLLAVGAITTIPIAIELLASQPDDDEPVHSAKRQIPQEQYAS